MGMVLVGAMSLSSCVTKGAYDNQKAQLKETQSKLREVEDRSKECDRDTFLQLKEQVQSLDILSQELVDRNTELSKEVARLKVFEASSKTENLSCDKKIEAKEGECQGKLDRVRGTYEDLVNELKSENAKLKAEIEKLKAKPAPAALAPNKKAPAPKK